MEFSLSEIIKLLINRFKIILVCIIIGFCVFYMKYSYFTSPIYTASVQLYVSSGDNTTDANLNELNYAQKVVTTYIGFLQTKTFFDQVSEACGLNYGPDQLKAMTTIQAVNSTEIFQINVTSTNPQDSYKLVRTMQNIAPDLIKSIKGTTEISVVDPAVLPGGPSGPNIRRNTIIGGILGFIIAVLTILLLEIFDVKVKDQEDIRKRYDIPLIGAIPNYHLYNGKRYLILNKFTFLNRYRKPKNRDKVVKQEKNFMINEAYNSLRTNLRFTIRKEGCKKIIICSPLPDDGKSTTSTNLAVTIAQTGAKVLLMDCDLRKGMLHKFFKLKSSPGISDALSGTVGEKDIIQYTSYENLDVVAMGELPPNPTELLGSLQMDELIKKLEKNYDYIIIDSPPVNVVSDSLSLVKLVDGVVIVVREGITTHPNVMAAVNKYKFIGANILGFVINGTNIFQNSQTKSKYYYYSRYKNNND